MSKFGDWIVRNWPEKVICLTLALFLFLFYRISNMGTKTVSLPLQIENSGSMTPSVPFLRNVHVTLRGESESIYAVSEEHITPYADLSHIREEGVYAVPVQIRLSGAASGIDPLEVTVDPPEITLTLERKAYKTLPVQGVFSGFPAEGYRLESFTLNPPSVEVSGPQSLVEPLEKLTTAPVVLSGWNTGFDGSADIVLPSDLLLLDGGQKVGYRVTIVPEITERQFPGTDIVFDSLRPGLQIAESGLTGTLVIQGPRIQLSRWTPSGPLLSVSCETVTGPGTYVLPVSAAAPRQFSVLRLEPREITVTVEEADE